MKRYKGKIRKIGRSIPAIMNSMKADHLEGVRLRTRIATVCALSFIAIYSIVAAFNYHAVPSTVPGFLDADGVLVEAYSRITFFRYSLELLLVLALTALVTRTIKPLFKDSFIYARTRCLVFDIANLYIATVAGILTVLVAIARGGDPDQLSYFEQILIFIFWTAVMVAEYVFDLRKSRKDQTAEQ